jgi:hypothetical protein
METIHAALADPEGQGILVRAGARSTPAISAAYTSFPPSRLSWRRGFLEGPPLVHDFALPPDRFIHAFGDQLRIAWGTTNTRGTARLTDLRQDALEPGLDPVYDVNDFEPSNGNRRSVLSH